jgi:hyperosmotically inducible protein
MKKWITSLSLVTLALGLASVATAEPVQSDSELKAKVEQSLEKKDLGAVEAEVVNGVVILQGKVKNIWAKNEAIKRALDIEAVSSVEDELEIAFAESDKALAEEIAKKVRSYAYFTVYDDINLGVEEGHVVLDGRVTMPFKSEELEKRVSKLLGVQSLTNNISTLPVNIGDSRLRVRLWDRIYGDTLFEEYSFYRNPPVHIIVERGRVTLTGAVRSEVERRKAEHIARSTFGVFKVTNRLVVGNGD